MRHSVRLAFGAGLAAFGLFAAGLAAGPAQAAPGQQAVAATAVCAQLAGVPAQTINVTGCPTKSTGGSGRISGFTQLGGKVLWKNHTTSTFKTTSSDQGPGTCPLTSAKFLLTGSVTASTNKVIRRGSKVSMVVCLDSVAKQLTNAPDTQVQF